MYILRVRSMLWRRGGGCVERGSVREGEGEGEGEC